MLIVIKTIEGQRTHMNVEPTYYVKTIKSKLSEQTGIYFGMIRLLYRGQQMDDAKTLAEHGVENGSVIHMLMQMRGG